MATDFPWQGTIRFSVNNYSVTILLHLLNCNKYSQLPLSIYKAKFKKSQVNRVPLLQYYSLEAFRPVKEFCMAVSPQFTVSPLGQTHSLEPCER